MAFAMLCQEYIRLRQQYESAVLHYGKVMLSPRDTELVGEAVRQAEKLKQTGLDERDEAKQGRHLHDRSCQVCNHNRHNPHLFK